MVRINLAGGLATDARDRKGLDERACPSRRPGETGARASAARDVTRRANPRVDPQRHGCRETNPAVPVSAGWSVAQAPNSDRTARAEQVGPCAAEPGRASALASPILPSVPTAPSAARQPAASSPPTRPSPPPARFVRRRDPQRDPRSRFEPFEPLRAASRLTLCRASHPVTRLIARQRKPEASGHPQIRPDPRAESKSQTPGKSGRLCSQTLLR